MKTFKEFEDAVRKMSKSFRLRYLTEYKDGLYRYGLEVIGPDAYVISFGETEEEAIDNWYKSLVETCKRQPYSSLVDLKRELL